MARLARVVLISFLLMTSTGCVLGPQSMRHSRMNYNRAVQVTAREEMLLNLVRMRYHQSVDFLRVPSITSQFRYATSLSGGKTWASNTISSLSFGGSAETKPTIVYTPEQEQDFNRRLFSPISLETIKFISSQGWAINRIGRIAIKSINNVENAIMAGGPTPMYKPEFEEFMFAMAQLRQIQLRGHNLELVFVDRESPAVTRSAPIAIDQLAPQDYISAEEQGMEWLPVMDGKAAILQTKASKQTTPLFRFSPNVVGSPEYVEVTRVFGLKPGMHEYFIVPDTEGQLKNPRILQDGSLAPQDRDEMVVSTRSLYEMMFYLSHSIEVPCEHIEKGLVRQTFDAEGNLFDWNELTQGIFTVHMSRHPPRDAAVAIRHRGHWFYIDASDLDSKSTFNLILELFNLEIRAGGGAQIPLLTL